MCCKEVCDPVVGFGMECVGPDAALVQAVHMVLTIDYMRYQAPLMTV